MDEEEDTFSALSRAFNSSQRDLQVELGSHARLSIWLVELRSRVCVNNHLQRQPVLITISARL